MSDWRDPFKAAELVSHAQANRLNVVVKTEIRHSYVSYGGFRSYFTFMRHNVPKPLSSIRGFYAGLCGDFTRAPEKHLSTRSEAKYFFVAVRPGRTEPLYGVAFSVFYNPDVYGHAAREPSEVHSWWRDQAHLVTDSICRAVYDNFLWTPVQRCVRVGQVASPLMPVTKTRRVVRI